MLTRRSASGPKPRRAAPEAADPSGLLAVGGDLQPERLLLAYSCGIFPWYEEGLPILWHAPEALSAASYFRHGPVIVMENPLVFPDRIVVTLVAVGRRC